MAFITIEEAIEEFKAGKMLVMVDDEDRENEGDIIFAGEFSTKELINFTISQAKGVLCTPVSEEVAKKLKLNLMVEANSSCHETAFTVSIDALGTTTGVSATERDFTIKAMCKDEAKPEDFLRPGHIFPLIAKKGGVLQRTGHTEGCVDLCKLAGLKEIAVCCEIVKEDGEMARRADLEIFCEKFGINMLCISDMVKYRLEHESLIQVSQAKKSKIADIEAEEYKVSDHLGNSYLLYKFGELKEESNVLFHSSLIDVNFLSSQNYDKFMKSLKYLEKNKGLLIVLPTLTQEENLIKNYGIGAQILKHFGIEKINLLEEDDNKKFVGISGFGLEVLSYVDIN